MDEKKKSMIQPRDSNRTKMTKGYQAKGRGGSQKSLGLDHMTLKGCGPGLDLWYRGKARGFKQGSGMKDLHLWKSILAPVTRRNGGHSRGCEETRGKAAV